MRTAVVSVIKPNAEVSVTIKHGDDVKTTETFQSHELAQMYLIQNGWIQSGLFWVEATSSIQPFTFMPKTADGPVVEEIYLDQSGDDYLVQVHALPVMWLGCGNVWTFYFSAKWYKGDPIIRLCVPDFLSSELCVGSWESADLAKKASREFLNKVMSNAAFKQKIDSDLYREFLAYQSRH